MSAANFTAASEAETIAAGEGLARELEPGAVVALCGQLGAGKTHFAKGIVAGLGADDSVTSPTFALVNEYRSGRVPVFHFDFYRLDHAGEAVQLGWDEYLDEGGIVVVEWADRFPDLFPEDTIWIELAIGEDGIHRGTLR
jgi:tRNA threonylcarbamoyladenosine biosynthesis protein TsaE